MLTDQELRQAIEALLVIEDRGNPDELAYVMREASDQAPTENPWASMTTSIRLHCSAIAGELCRWLAVPRDRAENAAADVFGAGQQRARFQALVNYAIELIGPCRELTGESLFVPCGEAARPAAVAPRPSIRIVADKQVGGAA